MQEFSRPAKELLALQEGLCSMELVIINNPTGLEEDLLMTNEIGSKYIGLVTINC
jgi:hypothetical protein